MVGYISHEALAKAISTIDGGCCACIGSFLAESINAFGAEDRKMIAKHFDLTSYPFDDVFDEKWDHGKMLKKYWLEGEEYVMD